MSADSVLRLSVLMEVWMSEHGIGLNALADSAVGVAILTYHGRSDPSELLHNISLQTSSLYTAQT